MVLRSPPQQLCESWWTPVPRGVGGGRHEPSRPRTKFPLGLWMRYDETCESVQNHHVAWFYVRICEEQPVQTSCGPSALRERKEKFYGRKSEVDNNVERCFPKYLGGPPRPRAILLACLFESKLVLPDRILSQGTWPKRDVVQNKKDRTRGACHAFVANPDFSPRFGVHVPHSSDKIPLPLISRTLSSAQIM